MFRVARPRVGSRIEFPQALRLSLFLGGSLLAASVFLLAHWAIDRLSREVTTTSHVLARFCAQASFPATRDQELQLLVGSLIANIDFPIVITDTLGVPRAWKGIDVDEALVPDLALDSLAAGRPIAPVVAARVQRVKRRITELDRRNTPIPMTRSIIPDTLGFVHYGEPPVLGLLRWTPFVALGGTLLLLGIGLGGLAVIRQSERRTIWVGMAKETAHQLGTPLSSLMGWSELLRARVPDPPHGDVRIGAGELAEMVGEMERDITRLRKVADRFSHIGSEPRLAAREVVPVVQDVVGYMRRRIPHGRVEVELDEHYEDTPLVRLNAELLQWALENLISNALNALDKRPARIDVTVQPVQEGRAVEITVADTGRGMTPGEQRRAFTPGYSTKRRGWGLGLPLTRRVVEDYHGGRVWIRSSSAQGTVMAIRLPAAP